MKIAVLGSASSSVGKAPFQNGEYAAWMQGKAANLARAHTQIGGEWDIWGCSPGCWAVAPRATRWFEVHRWEPGQPWFSPEYCQFLRDFKGPVYTGGTIPEIPNAVVYPIDRLEEKFSSYFMTSSLALMMAEAIDTIEQIREARKSLDDAAPSPELSRERAMKMLPTGIDAAELDNPDSDDAIGLWGVDMAAADEYAYQRPGCQFFVLEAMRRHIGVYLPPESDLMRPMPVYGISEWDHNYIKLTSRARELSSRATQISAQMQEAQQNMAGIQGEQHALQAFVSTWTSPYGMLPGMVIRQTDGTGLGSGITHFDGRPVSRMNVAPTAGEFTVAGAKLDEQDLLAAALGRDLVGVLQKHCGETGRNEGAMETVSRLAEESTNARIHSSLLQGFTLKGESTAEALRRLIKVAVKGGTKTKRKR